MTTATPSSVAPAAASQGGIAGLHPAYFAMVMATGIVSIGAHLTGLTTFAAALFYLNIAFYVGLCLLSLARVVLHPDRVLADLLSHGRSVGLFTTVAATSVLGSQFVVIADSIAVARWLWILSVSLWTLLTYTIFTAMTVKAAKPSLAEGIHGGWLVAVVAAQSVCVLGAQVAASFGAVQDQLLFFCLVMWLGGGMLYIWIISLIFYRYTFFAMSPADLSPPYWINMGAMAISTLAGSFLITSAPGSPLLSSLLPFLKGFTLLFWATATWWIPMLLVLGVWRHVFRRFPLAYDPLYWGAVFPLGMYTVCTIRLAAAVDSPFLLPLPRVFIWVSIAAWTLVFCGLLRTLLFRRRDKMPTAVSATAQLAR